MNKFCIITNRQKDEGLAVTKLVMSYLEDRNKTCCLTKEQVDNESYEYTDLSSIPEDTEAAIILGGDGTMIQAARDLVYRNIPIMGINLGTLGFLAEIERANLFDALNQLLNLEYDLEPHMMVSSVLTTGHQRIKERALNDIVVTRSGFSRLIAIGICVNGVLLSEFHGDGVILATPTGSTGYSLSAGGPVVIPEAELMLITPICPHTLNTRCIVVSASDTVTIRIMTRKKSQEEEAIATIDGIRAVTLHVGDQIEVRRSKYKTNLIRLKRQNFYNVLRAKLGGEA